MDYLPSASQLNLLANIIAFIVVAYYVQVWRKVGGVTFWTILRAMTIYSLLVAGGIGLYEGFTLGVREDYRARNGHVVPGLVAEKYYMGRRRELVTTRGDSFSGNGGRYLTTQGLARWLVYGTPTPFLVDYRYPCAIGLGGQCTNRDTVPPALWDRLQVGSPVNVRQADNETRAARLDENPQMALALAQMAISSLLLVAAGAISGHITLWRPRRYLSAPAVVLAVEQVQYREATRWKVRFAYFDRQGNAQESIDEVRQPTWKPGDDCVAVYQPETPGLATLQPAPSRSDAAA